MLDDISAGRLSPDGRIKDVRADHVARYQWAALQLSGHVIDAGCNCGYGAAILADAGLAVTAIDNWHEGLAYARSHWDRPRITWLERDCSDPLLPCCDAVIAFELVEHLEDPRPFLEAARRAGAQLFVSVPNEAVWPHEARLFPEHQRHYKSPDLENLLINAGWRPVEWLGQVGVHSPVERNVVGRTLITRCE